MCKSKKSTLKMDSNYIISLLLALMGLGTFYSHQMTHLKVIQMSSACINLVFIIFNFISLLMFMIEKSFRLLGFIIIVFDLVCIRIIIESLKSEKLDETLTKMLLETNTVNKKSLNRQIRFLLIKIIAFIATFMTIYFIYSSLYGLSEAKYFVHGSSDVSTWIYLLQFISLSFVYLIFASGSVYFSYVQMVIGHYVQTELDKLVEVNIERQQLIEIKNTIEFINFSIDRINYELIYQSSSVLIPLWITFVFGIPFLVANRNISLTFALITIGYSNFGFLLFFVEMIKSSSYTFDRIELFRKTAIQFASNIVSTASNKWTDNGVIYEAISLQMYINSTSSCKIMALNLIPLRFKLLLSFFNAAVPFSIIVSTSLHDFLVI